MKYNINHSEICRLIKYQNLNTKALLQLKQMALVILYGIGFSNINQKDNEKHNYYVRCSLY